MRPKRSAQSENQADLFRSELWQMIDPQHELVRLNQSIPWEKLDQSFGAYYEETMAVLANRPG